MKNGEFSSDFQPEGELWTDRKRTALFGLPISTTQYALTSTKLIIRRGLITLREDEVQLCLYQTVYTAGVSDEPVCVHGVLPGYLDAVSVQSFQPYSHDHWYAPSEAAG